MDDRAAVAAQIGRPPRSDVVVVRRCHLGLPVVTEVPPILDDGTPFPTTYWLSCPLAVARISRIESAGGIEEAARMIEDDPELAEAHRRAMERYGAHRDRMLPHDHRGPVPTGGVGGSRGGVKCLHAHYADHAAGNENPIGAWVADQIEPLDCVVPCVVGGAVNPEWSEPRR